MATRETVLIARDARTALAGKALTQRQAKLYSQRLRREMGREGLATFSGEDVAAHLDDAILLLECALIERAADPSSPWREGAKRSAEILEWLSQADLRPQGAPLHLLAAAGYQLAGYPAMALGHVRRMPNEPFSVLLRDFLRGHFPDALDTVQAFWGDQRVLSDSNQISGSNVSALAMRHTIMCIGTVCAYFRSGTDTFVERALQKLDHVA